MLVLCVNERFLLYYYYINQGKLKLEDWQDFQFFEHGYVVDLIDEDVLLLQVKAYGSNLFYQDSVYQG